MPNSMPGSGSMTQLASGAQLTFSKVTAAGQTIVKPSNSGPAAPPGYTLTGSGATYYDFTTSATFSGAVLVCVKYNPAQIANPSAVALLHYSSGNWQNITTSNNSTKGIICGEVTSLSPFAVATAQNPLTIEINPPAKAPVRIRLRKKGTIAMTIVSSQSFDATQLNPATILLSGAPVELIDKGKKYNCHPVKAKHLKNLACTMNLGELALAPGANIAVMTGVTNSGAIVQGAEQVKIVTK